MKTRIVYPQMWLDEKFAQCNVATKLLFCYLINNLQLGLSPYLHITDRQIMFDTGLNTNQLATGKEELSNLGWVYFTENWCFHNHKAAYIDYDGRDRVLESKEQEIANVPNKVKEVFKGLVTGYQPVLNHKSEIINNKEGGVGETKAPSNFDVFLKTFNECFSSSYQKTEGRMRQYNTRLKTFKPDQLLLAVTSMSQQEFYRGDNKRGWKADPDYILRSDENIDRFLNSAKPNIPVKKTIKDLINERSDYAND